MLQLIGMSLKVAGYFSQEQMSNIIEVVIQAIGNSSLHAITNKLGKLFNISRSKYYHL